MVDGVDKVACEQEDCGNEDYPERLYLCRVFLQKKYFHESRHSKANDVITLVCDAHHSPF